MKIIERKIADLALADYNPRELTKKQHKDLKDSLERFGFVDPVIVNTHPERKDVIVGGHQRMRIWSELGNKTIPTVEVSLTLKQEQELNVRLNKNVGQWDWDALANYFDKGELLEWGFETKELSFMELEVEAEEDDYEIPDQIKTDIVLGDLIEIGKHRLLCGDSTDSDQMARLMDGQKADMVVADPPYGVSYEGKTKKKLKIKNDAMSMDDTHVLFREALTSLLVFVKDGGGIYVTVPAGQSQLGFMQIMLEMGVLRQCMIWNKGRIVIGHSDYNYAHEPILYGWKPGASHYFTKDRSKSTVFDIAKPNRNADHPTMKPVKLWEEFIINSSKGNALISDPFLGSGTTMVAAHQLNRICYGMELDPKYCQVIIDRMMKLDSELEIKINGKKYKDKT